MNIIRFRFSRLAIFAFISIISFILFILFILFTCVLFLRPEKVNYYLSSNVVQDLKTTKTQCIVKKAEKQVYPRRKNMEECKPLFGKIGVFVAVDSRDNGTLYKIAQESLKCYLKSTNYEYFYINVDTDEPTMGKCNHSNIFYKRHCVLAHYLKEVDWMLFLDGDIGVVNPNHCIEEWIDDRVDMIFYERFFNWEIVSGSYLIKNTEQSYNFLINFADMEDDQFEGFTGYDNGVLQILILKAALPHAKAEIKACENIYYRSKTLEQYYNYVTCVKFMLGAVRVFPGVLRIYKRGHAWARDSHMTSNQWSDQDFMIHAWKASELNSTWFDANVFESIPDPKECDRSLKGWKWLPEKHVSLKEIQTQFSDFEKYMQKDYSLEGRDLPHLIEPDVGQCYPNCDKFT